VAQRKKEFKERTGKSGRTFTRARDELLDKSEKVKEALS